MSPSLYPTRSQPPALPPNYLLFSDVHLGADLVQHTRPWTVSRLRDVLRVDRELSAMIAHYRCNPDVDRPWKLIIAGDLIDFMGMSISPHADHVLTTPLTAEELSHGLGSAQDHVEQKMRAVAERHDLVFQELARFVADGHSLVLVRGNHDVEFYWEKARGAFVQALVERAPAAAVADASARETFESRIEFRHWFYYEEGLLYVEHGHQYDETCAHHHMLLPLSPRDPRRLAYSISDILMRYVVRPTRGMSMHGHEAMGFMDYIRMAFSMGLSGALRLGYRFGAAIMAMIQVWRDHLSERAKELRAEHDRTMQTIAERVRVGSDKLRALQMLWARPVTGRLGSILRTVFLDLLAAIAGSMLLIAVLLLTGVLPLTFVTPLAVALGAGIYAWMKSSRVIDQCGALRRGARRVSELLPTRFVIMGHTHKPLMERISEGVTYVNLGGWAVDDLDTAVVEPAPCTHLVIRHIEGRPHAELRRWCTELGPSILQATLAPLQSGVHLRPLSSDEQVA
jgi:UDP-2,3-diacylglucosamine pyrophosphatase LpxH